MEISAEVVSIYYVDTASLSKSGENFKDTLCDNLYDCKDKTSQKRQLSSVESFPAKNMQTWRKLNGVGPINNRPSSDKLHPIVKKKIHEEEKNIVTLDT